MKNRTPRPWVKITLALATIVIIVFCIHNLQCHYDYCTIEIFDGERCFVTENGNAYADSRAYDFSIGDKVICKIFDGDTNSFDDDYIITIKEVI